MGIGTHNSHKTENERPKVVSSKSSNLFFPLGKVRHLLVAVSNNGQSYTTSARPKPFFVLFQRTDTNIETIFVSAKCFLNFFYFFLYRRSGSNRHDY